MSDEDLSDAKWLRGLADENEVSLAKTERRVLQRIANRLEALTKQVESLMSGLGEAEIRCLSLTAENAKLREVIENHIAWWYKPKEHPDHSEAAYDKLREALREG